MIFDLSPAEIEKINKWCAEIDARVAKEQWEQGGEIAMWTAEGTIPYYGAIGGALTYSFTPTSLGTVVTVKHSREEKELDVTDYDEW